MLIREWIFAIIAAVVSCELNGEHVCQVEEEYPVNVTEYSLRNATVRNYKWCMGFPPRCSFYTFQTVRVPRIVEKFEKRTLKKCCPGYAESRNGDECVHCNKCFEGSCGIGGTCTCNPGFRGDDCGTVCEPNRWGFGCKSECLCERGTCNPRSGRCDCPTGWFGTRCELICLEGFYGKHCTQRCRCGERDLCNPETGECLKKYSQTPQHQSTRAIHYITGNILNITQTKLKQMSTPSLKKYYTFDMELTTMIPTFNKNGWSIQTSKLPNSTTKPSTHNINIYEKYNLTTDKNTSSPINKKTYQRTKTTKKVTINLDDSFESTTEMSVTQRKDENYIFINENGSLEKKINSGENSSENKKNIRRKNEATFAMKKTTTKNNGSTHTISKSNKSSEKGYFEVKYTSKNSGGSKEAKTNWPKKSLNKNDNSTSSVKETSAESGRRKFHRIGISNNTMQNYTTNINFKDTSKTSKIRTDQFSTKRNQNHLKNETGFITETFINTTPLKAKNVTPDKHAKEKTTVMLSKPTKMPQTTTASTNQLENIPPILKQTPSIIRSGVPNRQNDHKLVEEDELQNLNKLNILTSRETSTPLSTFITTVEYITDRKKEVLHFTEIIPSTRSFHEEFGNDISTAHSTHIKMKDGLDPHHQREENYLSDKSSRGYEYATTEENSLSAYMSMALQTTVFLVVVMSIMIIAYCYIQRKKKRQAKMKSDLHNYSSAPTVSVYTHSIFHSPLPDPPSFENPVFRTPIENSNEKRTFRTHVVCSLNIPNSIRLDEKELKEYTYDHPPSTGSYRAASIPEPPDITETVNTSEPVYDEIPSNGRMSSITSPPPSYKSSCIYANTCGKTRF